MILIDLIWVIDDDPVSHEKESGCRIDTISEIFLDHKGRHIDCIEVKKALMQK